MTDRELMQQALDVMEAAINAGDWKVDGACDPDWVLNALRAKLIKPTQAEKDKDIALAYQANVLGGFTDLHPDMIEFVRFIRADEREQCAQAAEAVVPRHTECGNKIAAAIRERGAP